MEAKFFIFVVFATVAKSSLALGSKNSCVVSTVKIKDDLETVNYATITALVGLHRFNELFYRSMYNIYRETYETETGTEHICSADTQQIFQSETKTENTSLIDTIEETLAAAMIGISPAIEATRVARPKSDVAAVRTRDRSVLQKMIEFIYYAIELTKSGNYSKSRAQIEVYENETILGGRTLINGFFNRLLNGSNYPAETQASLACLYQSIESKIVGALRVVFYAIKLLHSQLSTETSAGSEDCLLAIKAAEGESNYLLQAEVIQKYAVIRILVIAKHLNETGIIDGLLALQSEGIPGDRRQIR